MKIERINYSMGVRLFRSSGRLSSAAQQQQQQKTKSIPFFPLQLKVNHQFYCTCEYINMIMTM